MSPPSTVGPPARYRYSIVIPTFQRREIVGATVSALIRMDHPSFEIIVVVDGSTDGTSAALAAMRLAVPLQVVEQQNLGASRARNRGAALARGDIILFLDDDMLAEPELLMQHDQAYADGADAVLGHMPVAASSPRSFLSRGVAQWAEERRERLAHTGGGLTLPDLLTGQLSVRRGLFESLNGFDEHFTRGGSFGGEDTDFGKRLLDARYHVVFAPAAVSSQHYAVSPRSNLQQWHQAGHADVTYVRKHPGEHDQIFASHRPHRRTNEYLLRPLARVPAISTPVAAVGRRVVVALAQRRPESSTVGKLFFLVRNLEYWRGVQESSTPPRQRSFRVLCYHSVQDLRGAAKIEQYGIPAPWLRLQLKRLQAQGYHFISLKEALNALDGTGDLPRRAVLLTFDDCFADLLTNALPVLREARVPAVAFAVSRLVGSTNTWDTATAPQPCPCSTRRAYRHCSEPASRCNCMEVRTASSGAPTTLI